jgi:hypothetical protein
VVAGVLHSPSHVSLESALAFHGWIPEAVYQVSSITVARSRTFTTPLGVFSFGRVPSVAPRAGVEAVAVGRDAWAFIASPVRAIADMIYLRRNVSWNRDGLAYLTEGLRVEQDDLRTISFDAMDEILDAVRSRRVGAFIKGLKGAVRHAA